MRENLLARNFPLEKPAFMDETMCTLLSNICHTAKRKDGGREKEQFNGSLHSTRKVEIQEKPQPYCTTFDSGINLLPSTEFTTNSSPNRNLPALALIGAHP